MVLGELSGLLEEADPSVFRAVDQVFLLMELEQKLTVEFQISKLFSFISSDLRGPQKKGKGNTLWLAAGTFPSHIMARTDEQRNKSGTLRKACGIASPSRAHLWSTVLRQSLQPIYCLTN